MFILTLAHELNKFSDRFLKRRNNNNNKIKIIIDKFVFCERTTVKLIYSGR